MSKITLMKVLDCQDFPDDVRNDFFSRIEGQSNDSYVDWWIEDLDKEDLVNNYLISLGLENDESILIRFWW